MKEFFRKIDESVGIYRFALNAVVITVLLFQLLWGFIGTIGIALVHFNTVFTGNIFFWFMLLIAGNAIVWIIEKTRMFNKSKKVVIDAVEQMNIEILTQGFLTNKPSGIYFSTKLAGKTNEEKYDIIDEELLTSSKVYTQNNYKITEGQIDSLRSLRKGQIFWDELITIVFLSAISIFLFLILPAVKINPMDITIHMYKKDLEYSTLEYKQNMEDKTTRITELTQIKDWYSKIWAIDKVKEIQSKIDVLNK